MYYNKFSLIQEEDETTSTSDIKRGLNTKAQIELDKSTIIIKNDVGKIMYDKTMSKVIDKDHPYFKTKNITKQPDIKYSDIVLRDDFPETAFIDINNCNILPNLSDKHSKASDLENIEYKYPNHWGQRKLLLSEIYFLTQIYEDKEIIVIYAGAAPGTHLPILLHMFPKITFHLYDPKRFDSCLKLYSNVIVNLYYDNINAKYKEGRNKKYGLFTSEVAKWYNDEFFTNKDKEGTDFYFISDIRTVPKNLSCVASDFTNKFEREVIKNQTEQMNWISIMKPRLSMLKFKMPYPAENREQYYRYLKGQIYLQVWSPTSSSETRLFVSYEDLDYTGWYDIITYERKLAYYNYLRQHSFNDYKIPFLEGITLRDWWKNFVDNVEDFTIDFYNELLILKNYYDKFIKSSNEISLKDYLAKQIIDMTNLLNIIYIQVQSENDKDIKDYNKIFRLRKSVTDMD